MSFKPYKTLLKASETETVINKSRFIGRAFPIETEDEAKEILARLRKQHYDATHNCFAYALKDGTARYSDDGEPGGTAGMPIMEVLKARALVDTLIVVTRYFGGILLGAGGLVRAYSGSAAAAVDAAGEAQVLPASVLRMELGYERYGTLEGYVRDNSCTMNAEFLERVYITATVLTDAVSAFTADIIELTDGRVTPSVMGEDLVRVPIERKR